MVDQHFQGTDQELDPESYDQEAAEQDSTGDKTMDVLIDKIFAKASLDDPTSDSDNIRNEQKEAH